MFKKERQTDLEIFAIYDSKTQSYGAPVTQTNHHALLRDLTNLCKDPNQANNQYVANAEDFSVFRIATYDKKQGILSAQNPEHIVNMHDIRAIASTSPGIVPT